jgi:predicted Abi (CAAX) family protease
MITASIIMIMVYLSKIYLSQSKVTLLSQPITNPTNETTGITGNQSPIHMFHQIIDVLWSIAVTTLVRAATHVYKYIYMNQSISLWRLNTNVVGGKKLECLRLSKTLFLSILIPTGMAEQSFKFFV